MSVILSHPRPSSQSVRVLVMNAANPSVRRLAVSAASPSAGGGQNFPSGNAPLDPNCQGSDMSTVSPKQVPLWIGIHLPQLPLETVLRGSPSPDAWAVAEGDRILLADRKAQARGVRPGMLCTAALALAPQLRIRLRDGAAETERLLGIAAWAAQYTPSVALEFPDTLLLEVAGSLRLFGGLEKILAALRHGLAELGFVAQLGVAPTTRAASWLARSFVTQSALKSSTTRPVTAAKTPATIKSAVTATSAPAPAPAPASASASAISRSVPSATSVPAAPCAATPVATPETLKAALAPLPVSLLRGKADLPEALANLGIATLGEFLALPRDGLARRFGQGLLDQLDQALGAMPDPRIFFTIPASFHAGIELPSEVTQAQALLFAGKRLLAQLSGFLTARSGGVQRFSFRLAHREGRSTVIDVGLVAPARDAEHFALLLRERLGKLALREPVRSLSLEAGNIQPLAGANRSLLVDDKAATASSEWPQLIERLRARLGAQAVQAIGVAAEHRPENASCPVEDATHKQGTPGAKSGTGKPHSGAQAGSKQLQLSFGERPFWLLDAPRALAEKNAVPQHEDGPLTLLAGPERIESGWWDGGDVKRDYFIARTPRDALVWVYRERQAGWYLHGIFS